MRTIASIMLGSLLLAGGLRGSAQEKGVSLQDIKYPGLQELVVKNRGKVVVVDFWSTSCPPCIRNFPHMVGMQKKYGKDGLVSISVSLDKVDKDETPAQMKGRVLKLLQKLEANIPNVLLDETQKLVEDKLRITSIPCIYVFNRQGKWTKFGGDDESFVKPPEVEKLVMELLQEKEK